MAPISNELSSSTSVDDIFTLHGDRCKRPCSITWEDKHRDQSIGAARLRELTVLIRSIIESKPEYKALPQPKGGYM